MSSENAPPSPYIISPWQDRLLLIYAPFLAVLLGVLTLPLRGYRWRYGSGFRGNWVAAFILVFTSAHLVIVFFRSHGNPKIRQLYPFRFYAAPLLLFFAMVSSIWVAATIFVLAIWWDVYHSAMQTFGIGRIYDAKQGNQAELGRSLDLGINALLYIGPILAGATLMSHTNALEIYKYTGSMFFQAIPVTIDGYQRYFVYATVGLGLPYLCYYVFAYWRLSRAGYRVSPQKVALLTGTGLCSIYAWGFNSFGMAFFIMNFFHALQYFALIWWSEKKSIARIFRLEGLRWGAPAALTLLIVTAFGYGLAVIMLPFENKTPGDVGFSIIVVISIMHFWYDGFIWSVRKKQV